MIAPDTTCTLKVGNYFQLSTFKVSYKLYIEFCSVMAMISTFCLHGSCMDQACVLLLPNASRKGMNVLLSLILH